MDEGRCQRRLEDGVGSPGFGGLQVVVSCPVQVWETELWPSAQHLLNNNNNNDNSNTLLHCVFVCKESKIFCHKIIIQRPPKTLVREVHIILNNSNKIIGSIPNLAI